MLKRSARFRVGRQSRADGFPTAEPASRHGGYGGRGPTIASWWLEHTPGLPAAGRLLRCPGHDGLDPRRSGCPLLLFFGRWVCREVLEWLLDVPFEELRASQVTFVCIGSITSSPDSVQSFLNWVGELGDQISHLVLEIGRSPENECLRVC